jgi:hypothetical protein
MKHILARLAVSTFVAAGIVAPASADETCEMTSDFSIQAFETSTHGDELGQYKMPTTVAVYADTVGEAYWLEAQQAWTVKLRDGFEGLNKWRANDAQWQVFSFIDSKGGKPTLKVGDDIAMAAQLLGDDAGEEIEVFLRNDDDFGWYHAGPLQLDWSVADEYDLDKWGEIDTRLVSFDMSNNGNYIAIVTHTFAYRPDDQFPGVDDEMVHVQYFRRTSDTTAVRLFRQIIEYGEKTDVRVAIDEADGDRFAVLRGWGIGVPTLFVWRRRNGVVELEVEKDGVEGRFDLSHGVFVAVDDGLIEYNDFNSGNGFFTHYLENATVCSPGGNFEGTGEVVNLMDNVLFVSTDWNYPQHKQVEIHAFEIALHPLPTITYLFNLELPSTHKGVVGDLFDANSGGLYGMLMHLSTNDGANGAWYDMTWDL